MRWARDGKEDSPVRGLGAVVSVEAALLPVVAIVDARAGCLSGVCCRCRYGAIGDHAARLTILTRITRFQFRIKGQLEPATLVSVSTALFCVTT